MSNALARSDTSKDEDSGDVDGDVAADFDSALADLVFFCSWALLSFGGGRDGGVVIPEYNITRYGLLSLQ